MYILISTLDLLSISRLQERLASFSRILISFLKKRKISMVTTGINSSNIKFTLLTQSVLIHTYGTKILHLGIDLCVLYKKWTLKKMLIWATRNSISASGFGLGGDYIFILDIFWYCIDFLGKDFALCLPTMQLSTNI